MNTVEIGRENSANLKTINLSDLFSGLTIQVPAEIEKNRIEQAFKLYLEEHPEIISRVTQIACSKPPSEDETWASVAQELKRNAMGKEAGEAMEKARKEFRETFAVGDNF